MTLINSSIKAEVSIKVDTSSIACKNFLGFGNEWDSRAYAQNKITDKDYKLIQERLAWMKLPIARIMIIGNMCYKGKGVFDFETPEMQSLYKHLDICQKLGIDVILTDWGCQSEWLKVPDVKNPADKKYAEIIATYTDYLINKKKYNCIKYLVMINEPNLYPVQGQWENWSKGIKNLSAELKKRNLDKKIILTGSDESCNDKWHYKTVDELKKYFGAYDVHKYANDEEVKIGKLYNYFNELWKYAKSKDADAKYKQFIVGEAGLNNFANHPFGNEKINSVYYGEFMADYAVQAANAGSSAVLAWMLDDNSHLGFYWGLWSNKNNGMKLRPWFFTWSLLVKYFPKGSTIYKVKQPTKNIRVLVAGFKNSKNKPEWSICIVNRSDKSEKIKIKFPIISAIKMKCFLYNEQNHKTDKHGFPLPVSTKNIDLEKGIVCPANTVIILTTAD